MQNVFDWTLQVRAWSLRRLEVAADGLMPARDQGIADDAAALAGDQPFHLISEPSRYAGPNA